MPDFDPKPTLAGIERALREWAARPDVKCMDCGLVKMIPNCLRTGMYDQGEGWTVDHRHPGSGSLEVNEWIKLEENPLDARGTSYEIKLRLLCPACRKNHAL